MNAPIELLPVVKAKDLAREIAEGLHLPINLSEAMVRTLSASIANHLCQHHEVVLPGLGRFKIGLSKARLCRNPRTGESVMSKDSRKIKFRLSAPVARAAR